jgi:DhnA family fructose-bisphosphate aldolase class Ia
MSGKYENKLRMSRVINPKSGKTLILEVDWMNNAYAEIIVKDCRDYCDGVIVNKDQVNHLRTYLMGSRAPGFIIQIDWKNFYQGLQSPLYQNLEIVNSAVEEAVLVGASSIISSLIIGYERDEDEARNLEAISFLARTCERANIPLIIRCLPIGKRVTRENFCRCVELGARVAMEAGADIVAVPYTGDQTSFNRIVYGVNVPVLLLDMQTPLGRSIDNIKLALEIGAVGAIISYETLKDCSPQKVKTIYEVIHGGS